MSPSAAVAGHSGSPAKVPRIAWPPLAIIAVAWIWAFYAFAQYWTYLPQYAYGWLVPMLAAFFFWRRLSMFAAENPAAVPPPKARDSVKGVLLLLLLVAAIVPLELYRERNPLSRTVVWGIGLNAVAITLLTLGWMGGRKLRKAMIFPIGFALVSAPWITAVEQPLVNGMAAKLSAVIVDLLQWVGFIAERDGTVISMAPGPVGVDEACSGIRSIQSGTMYAIALGELFLLTVPRRFLMVAISLSAALLLNLTRTFILCWAVDSEGTDVLEKQISLLGMENTVHDWVGGVISLVLPVIVWFSAKLLSQRELETTIDPSAPRLMLNRPLRQQVLLKVCALVAAAGFVSTTGLAIVHELRSTHQENAFFTLKDQITTNAVSKTVWDQLTPTIGQNFSVKDPRIENGVQGYKFFWEPSAGNIYILGHRPDVCMSGAGWVLQGETRKLTLKVGNQDLSWYAFAFKNRVGIQALQIWGVWRDGRPVDINYDRSTFDRGTAVPWLKEAGDRKSGMEIVSMVFYHGKEAPTDAEIEDIVNSTFNYSRPVQQ